MFMDRYGLGVVLNDGTGVRVQAVLDQDLRDYGGSSGLDSRFRGNDG